MNAIDLCKIRRLNNLSELYTYVIELDLEINQIKRDIKLYDYKDKVAKLQELKKEIRTLQGHLNSLIAKREKLIDRFGDLVGRCIVLRLFSELDVTYNDVEFGKIRVICRKGGFDLYVNNEKEFVESEYKKSELYKLIQCD